MAENGIVPAEPISTTGLEEKVVAVYGPRLNELPEIEAGNILESVSRDKDVCEIQKSACQKSNCNTNDRGVLKTMGDIDNNTIDQNDSPLSFIHAVPLDVTAPETSIEEQAALEHGSNDATVANDPLDLNIALGSSTDQQAEIENASDPKVVSENVTDKEAGPESSTNQKAAVEKSVEMIAALNPMVSKGKGSSTTPSVSRRVSVSDYVLTALNNNSSEKDEETTELKEQETGNIDESFRIDNNDHSYSVRVPHNFVDDESSKQNNSTFTPSNLYEKETGETRKSKKILTRRGSKPKKEEIIDDKKPKEDIEEGKTLSVLKSERLKKKLNLLEKTKKNDSYCWFCHKSGNINFKCSSCLKSCHTKCFPVEDKIGKESTQSAMSESCPDCEKERAEVSPYSSSQLQESFTYLTQRTFSIVGYGHLSEIVENNIKMNLDCLVNPVTFSVIEEKVQKQNYSSCFEIVDDFNWVLHNMTIIGLVGELKMAKIIQKTAKRESFEIQTCLECYNRANTMQENWFVEPCERPHLLVWARLKGYPFWPAKAMRHIAKKVDVRFFGAHDRAWVPAKDIFLYSRDIPQQPAKNKRSQNLEECIDEIEEHIVRLKKKFGGFAYRLNRTRFQVSTWEEHLRKMLPNHNTSETLQIAHIYDDDTPVIKRRKICSDSIEKSESASPLLTEIVHHKEGVADPFVALSSLSPVSDVTKSPASSSSSNPPLKLKLKLDSCKRNFATITPEHNNSIEEKSEKSKKRRKNQDSEESETESKKSENAEITEPVVSATEPPSHIETAEVSDPPQEHLPPTANEKGITKDVKEDSDKEKKGDTNADKTPKKGNDSSVVLNEEIQKLMSERKCLSLLPKPKSDKPTESKLTIKRTARKTFPSVVGTPVVQQIVPENITIKAEPPEFDEENPTSPVVAHELSPKQTPAKPRAAVPALRAIHPSSASANVERPPTIAVRPDLASMSVLKGTIRAPIAPVQPAPFVSSNECSSNSVDDPFRIRVNAIRPPPGHGMFTSVNGHPPEDPFGVREMAKQESERLLSTIQICVDNILNRFASQGNPYAQMAKMQVEMHVLKKKFHDQLEAAKKAADSKLHETRTKLISDHEKAVSSLRSSLLLEKKKSIEETKRKQWCANCGELFNNISFDSS
ncbi:hypothetical protein QYM36_002267 [Artemia franciscana]|uniref:PWWP domain-containing protein n=1 Tax=Artemia franciscana TaxID=6661 RepID=A0AA88IGM2_ARTSF|nr:hypothetical protein QYM36_002267 [Artemia franciscana]